MDLIPVHLAVNAPEVRITTVPLVEYGGKPYTVKNSCKFTEICKILYMPGGGAAKPIGGGGAA
jgi:hypothetical protein